METVAMSSHRLGFLKVDKRGFERMIEDEGGDRGRRMDGRIRIWIWR
jgi:hypothetical protein